MLIRTSICLLFFGFFITAKSQNFKFGKPELSELQSTICPIDSSADAYIIGEFGQTRFDIRQNGFKVIYNYSIRIKILKKSAFEWATHSIPYYKSVYSKEYVSSVKGYTYNLVNGKIVEEKLGKDGIFDEQKGKELFITKFTMPNVKEGTVLEYNYEIVSDYFTIPTWSFQTSIPTLWSQYQVSIPEYFTYSVNSQGYEVYELSKIGRGSQNITVGANNLSVTTTEYDLAVKNAPALRDEAYTTTIQDYISKATFELAQYQLPGQMVQVFSNSIVAINKRLIDDDDFGRQINKVGFLDDAISAINASSKDTLTRIARAVGYLQSKLKWNEEEGIYTSDLPKKVFENHTGNVADLNLMLVGMLRKMKLMANPVLISTRDHGRVVDTNPQLKNFNYVVAMVESGGNWIYLDITDPFLRIGTLPLQCLNGTGLMIAKDEGAWVEIKPNDRFGETKMMTLKLNDEGVCEGKLSTYQLGYSSFSDRKFASSATKEKFEERHKKAYSNWDIKNIDYKNADSVNLAFEIHTEFSTSEGVNVAGNRIYFKPFLDEGFTKNPFQKTERKYPVSFGALTDETIIVNCTLPEGYAIEDMPKNEIVNLPENGGRFMFMSQVTGNKLQITTKLNLKKATYYAEEYPYLKEFFDKIVAKQTIQLALVKK